MKQIFAACRFALCQEPEGVIFQLEADTNNLVEKAMEVAEEWLYENPDHPERFMTWQDLITTIPKDFCKKHGLLYTEISDNIEFVNLDDELTEE